MKTSCLDTCLASFCFCMSKNEPRIPKQRAVKNKSHPSHYFRLGTHPHRLPDMSNCRCNPSFTALFVRSLLFIFTVCTAGFPCSSPFAWFFMWIPRFIVWDSGEALPVSNLVLSGDLYATTLGLMCLCYKSGFRNPQIGCWFSGRRPSTTKCHFPWTLSHRPWLLCICLAWQNLMSWFKSSLGRLYLAWCHDQIWKRTGFNSLS